jgi:hypothetical protein
VIKLKVCNIKCRILVGKPEGNRLFRRPRHSWEDNIKINLMEIGWENFSGAVWGLVADSYEYGNEPLGSIKGRKFLVYPSVSAASMLRGVTWCVHVCMHVCKCK